MFRQMFIKNFNRTTQKIKTYLSEHRYEIEEKAQVGGIVGGAVGTSIGMMMPVKNGQTMAGEVAEKMEQVTLGAAGCAVIGAIMGVGGSAYLKRPYITIPATYAFFKLYNMASVYKKDKKEFEKYRSRENKKLTFK